LLVDPPASGSWNMAVDEALLESAAAGVTTLRFYQWSEPTLSLGYFQKADERRGHAASLACPLVRRASGGGAIVHDQELTYCFAAPIAGRLAAAAAALYDTFHDTLIEALAGWKVTEFRCEAANSESPAGRAQPFLCFERRMRGDVLCRDAKVAGSAQRRQRGGLLQHGSVLLVRSRSAPQLAGIYETADVSLDPGELAEAWIECLRRTHSFTFDKSNFLPHELAQAREIELSRFQCLGWTFRR
jgi:lipoate-protein ligase A